MTSTLLEASSVEKIVEIDRHIGCAMSGLQADARSMIEHARVESQNHSFHYNEPLRVESCTQGICDLALRFGEGANGEDSIMSRPFGVALLIAGFDEDGPQLYGVRIGLHKLTIEGVSLESADSDLGTMRSHQELSTDTTPRLSDRDPKVLKRSYKMNFTSLLRWRKLKHWC